MADNEILQQMRDVLVPKGSADLVRLGKTEMFFESGFVKSCLNELSRMRILAVLGEEASPLQKLAYEVLKSSAFIEQQSK